MIRVAAATLGSAFLLIGTASAMSVNEAEPYELVRTLRTMQDQSAKGSSEAFRAQRELARSISTQLVGVGRERWNEPRNARAAVLYVLSGGDLVILRKVLGFGGMPAQTEKLMQGALAFAEGRNEEAGELLLDIEARALEPGLGGAVALAQSTLVAATDPKRAMALLDEARLLSPGTLVEEAALRRQIVLLSKTQQPARLESLLARYIRSFRKSVYAASFWRQLAAEIAASKVIKEPDRMTRLALIFDRLDIDAREQLYLSMAREGLARGKLELTRFATEMAAKIGRDDVRAQLYSSAALIVTDGYDRGLATLSGIEPEKLDTSDAELLEAALAVAHRIRRAPDPGLHLAEQENGLSAGRARELSEIGLRTIERAQTVMASVDALLSGTAR